MRLLYSLVKNIDRDELSCPDGAADTGRWLALAIGSLLLAGCFSLLPLVARVPGLNAWFADPHLARRCLVVHVNLALEVWFLAFLAALTTMVPRRASSGDTPAPWIAASGVLALIVAGFLPEATPVLSNYIPVIDSPLFMAGLLIFFGAVAFALVEFLAHRPPPETRAALPHIARTGLKAAAAAFLIGCLTLLITLATTPVSLEPKTYYERVFWG